jgi:hypothetical protein
MCRGKDVPFAIIDRQAEATVGRIIKALLGLKLEPAASRDFVRTPDTDFLAHPVCALPRLAARRDRFGKQSNPAESTVSVCRVQS